jgi:hypothetical protein
MPSDIYLVQARAIHNTILSKRLAFGGAHKALWTLYGIVKAYILKVARIAKKNPSNAYQEFSHTSQPISAHGIA